MNKFAKYRCLTPVQKEIRIKIMDFIIETGGPVNIDKTKEYICRKMNLEETYASEVLKQFIDTNVMVMEGDNISFIFPVSGHPTNHAITLADGRKFCAMCAIDSIGTNFTFRQDVEVNSVCSSTGKPLKLMVSDGKVVYTDNPDLRIIHINLEKHSEWASSC